MSTQDFFNQYNGKGIDFDGYYGFQCMDLFEQYNKDVIGCPVIGGNAIDVPNTYNKDFYEWVANTPDGVPAVGDVIIWGQGVGQYGHIAVFKDGDQNNFTSFDQNWPLNSLCHFQSHNYNNVLGWLHPKAVITPIDLQKELDQVRTDRDKNWNLYQDTLKQLTECQNRPPITIEKTIEVPSTTTVQVPINQQNTATTATVTPDSTNTIVTSPDQPNLDVPTHTNTVSNSGNTWIVSFFNWLLGR